jgi:hypothetical protein
MSDGGSARARAEQLWAQAAAERELEDEARARAEALEAQAGAWAAGAEGERRVARVLVGLPNGWVVLHDRLLRPLENQVNLDHVVIGPGGVFLVDAKNWAGGVSVHDGNLWQHKGRSAAKGAELDKLAAFAGEMERSLQAPVVPVVALAGGHGARFRAQRIRGVEVVPCGRLSRWLQEQRETTDAAAVELLSRRISHTYPPATQDDAEPPASGTTALTVPKVVAARPSRAGGPRGRRSPGSSHPTRRRPSAFRAIAFAVLLLALSQLAPLLPRMVGSALSQMSAPRSDPSVGAAAALGKDCQALTRDVIAKVTGAKVVREQARAGDTCAWWLGKPRYANQVADVTVSTGTSVRISLSVTGSTESRIDMMPGEVTAWLPENTALAGWKSGRKAGQAFSVSLRFSYPRGAGRDVAQATEAAAEKTVSQLAEQAALALGRRTSP